MANADEDTDMLAAIFGANGLSLATDDTVPDNFLDQLSKKSAPKIETVGDHVRTKDDVLGFELDTTAGELIGTQLHGGKLLDSEVNWDDIGLGKYGELSTYMSLGELDVGAAPGQSNLEEVKFSEKERRGMKSSVEPRKAGSQINALAALLKKDDFSSNGASKQSSTSVKASTTTTSGQTNNLQEQPPRSATQQSTALSSLFSRFSTAAPSTHKGSAIAPLDPSKLLKKEVKKNRSNFKHGLPRQELTPELERELKALSLRKYADPTRFYRANDSKNLPTHFHVGRVVGGSGYLAPVDGGGKKTAVDVLGDHGGGSGKKRGRGGKSYMSQLVADAAIQNATKKTHLQVGAWGQEGSMVGGKKKGGKKGKNKNAWKVKKRK